MTKTASSKNDSAKNNKKADAPAATAAEAGGSETTILSKKAAATSARLKHQRDRTLLIYTSAALTLVAAVATAVWMWSEGVVAPSEVLATMGLDKQPPRWGTFRPNVYFGAKARVPNSPLFGMIW